MRRNKMSKGKSKSLFTHTAANPHPKNFRAAPVRGGYRL